MSLFFLMTSLVSAGGENHRIKLMVSQQFVTLEYRIFVLGSPSEAPWKPCPLADGRKTTQEAGAVELDLPANQSYQIRGWTRSTESPISALFWRKEGAVEVLASDSVSRPLSLLESVFWPTPAGWAIIVSSILSVPLGFLIRNLRRHRLQAQVSQHVEEQLEARQLILPDGSLPKKIGNYRPTAILGSGAMGVVYKAESADKVPFAIKVPLPNLVASEEFRLRFMRELELGLTLKHPHLVQVFSLPEGEYPYIVMEWVQAPTMDQVERLPILQELSRCRVWLEQILDALVYVHERNVLHRDLKPSNLMVQNGTNIKIMDFGIAQKVHGTRLTGTDSVLGTPTYMAPEQLLGQTLDGRADLFALGTLIYERIVGQLPLSQDVVTLMTEKLTKPLPPLNTVCPEVSPEIALFVTRMISIDRDDRWPSAAEALAGLRELWR